MHQNDIRCADEAVIGNVSAGQACCDQELPRRARSHAIHQFDDARRVKNRVVVIQVGFIGDLNNDIREIVRQQKVRRLIRCVDYSTLIT